MGRPTRKVFTHPSFAVRTWATDANYPAGSDPWSSNPTKVEPASPAEGFVPGTGASAEEVNKLFNDAFTQDASAETALDTNVTEDQQWADKVLDYVGQMPFYTMLPPAMIPSGLLPACNRAAYDQTARVLLVTSDSGKLFENYHLGSTWPGGATNVLSGVSAGTEKIRFIDTDGLGAAVAACDSRKVFTRTAAGVWAAVNVAGGGAISGPTGGESTQIVYDPFAALWIWVGWDGVGGPLVQTSPDRATWTARTMVGGQYPVNDCMRLVTAGGRTTLVTATNSTTVKVSTSDDGGITWIARADLTTAIAGGPTYMSMRWNTETGTRMLVLADANQTWEVWTTIDGATWTKVGTFSGVASRRVVSIAPYGAAWVAMYNTGILIYSLDEGVSWKHTGYEASSGGTPKSLAMVDGGIVVVQNLATVASLRSGSLGAAVT